jgi:GTP pyrophosphokinase
MIKLTNHDIQLADNQVDINQWLHAVAQKMPTLDIALTKKALEFISSKTETKNEFGKSCLHEGLMMADTLSSLGIDTETLIAALIFPVVKHENLELLTIEKRFGPEVAKLIKNVKLLDNITKFSKRAITPKQKNPNIDNLRKMSLAIINDIRAVLIKLTEHLYILRNAKELSREQQIAIAHDTMDIYASLANRLGIGNFKWEMEDLAFRYLNPDEYKRISQALKQRRIDREKYVKQSIDAITAVLQKSDLKDFQINGRAKHIYSIYRKMQRKDLEFTEIYDAVALRILVNNVKDCYKALSYIHANWSYVPSEFDDYVTTPKPNGYQSIHTVIIGAENKYVEIQIRTNKMHEDAEMGNAAHWVYKEQPQKATKYEAKIAWLRQVMDWHHEIADTEINAVREIFQDRVYVFTPEGDIIDLPNGATPLDFAYHVHSTVGHRCRGAKVNGKMVTLHYQLKTGDQVEILTGKEEKPSRDWLRDEEHFLQSKRAKQKVAQWFKRQN